MAGFLRLQNRRNCGRFIPALTLRLIDLAGPGSLVRIGVDARLFAGEYQRAQLWSKALHDHPDKADGLLYPSRLDPSRRAIALFLDRRAKFTELSRQSWYAPGPQRVLLAEIAEHYKIELIENELGAATLERRTSTHKFKQLWPIGLSPAIA
jgi:hypothetical protein